MAPSVSSTISSTSTSSDSDAPSIPSSNSSSSSSISSNSPPHSPITSTTAATLATKRSLVPARWTDCSVRTVGMAECRDAALTLAHAFAADDYAQYVVADDVAGGGGGGGDMGGSSGGGGGGGGDGDGSGGGRLTAEEAKWRLHVDFLTYTVASHCMSGLVTAVGAECDCVALWVPPGKHLDGWWTQLRSGMWRLYFQLSPEGKKRYFDEILPRLHEAKVQVLGDRDAWYLNYLGTRPNSQGRGYAAKLLHDMMARADAEQRPMYLESSSQANNAYYEKFGFEVQRDVLLERGPVPVRLSIMVREPRVPGCKAAYASRSSMVKKFVVGAKGLMG
ncbi:GCN5-related N-acetyltransferase-like protein [Chaetomium sp. MPI-CAGE-AT-0009]|nr:GCN5-related N-acetyltransferase-like protein [Chaetomium sp. MPI-CAGE-AT-0009]